MNNWLKYGLIYGLISIIFLFISYYLLNLGLGSQMMVGILLAILISIWVAKEERASKGGYLTYGESLKVIFLALTVGAIISVLFLGIMVSFIDPGLAEIMAEQGLESTRSMMETMGAPEDVIEKTMAEAEDNLDSFSFKSLLSNTPVTLIMNLIYAAIISLFMKKKNPANNEYL